MRRNDWTLGAFRSRYCNGVVRHHSLEDTGISPHLARSEPALVHHIDNPGIEPLARHGFFPGRV